ncbi:MAG TPA: ABC transporter substrate-binding protein [Acidimicrobiales bacterium]|jgi:branched-chain amino acid transport system substrate-binding protein
MIATTCARLRGSFIALLLVSLLVVSVAGCGARLSPSQYAAAVGGGGGGAATGAGARQSVASNPAAAGPATSSEGPGASVASADPGAAQPGAAAAPSGGCAPQHSDAPGVTDNEIKLGNVSTISGPIPNFGATGRAGAKAYIDYINSQGGVCGRHVSMVTADDRLDPGVNRSTTEQLESQVLGFVGNTSVEDDGGASVIGGSNVPDCSLTLGSNSITQPNYFSPIPIDPSGQTNDTTAIWQWFKANKGITKVGIVYPDNPTAAARIQGYQNDIAAAGLAVDTPIKVAVTETNYVGVASQMKNNGDDAFITALEINGIAKFAQAIRQVGWTPKAPFYGSQAYSPLLTQLAGPAADGTVLGLAHDIVEGGGPAMENFAQIYKASSSGQPLDFFAIMGWTSAKLCLDAIAAAGAAPTRDAVIGALNQVTNFTADGIIGGSNPAQRKGPTGFDIVTISGGQWQRVYPGQGFAPS